MLSRKFLIVFAIVLSLAVLRPQLCAQAGEASALSAVITGTIQTMDGHPM
jgi:hypothetical protein